MNVLSEPKTFFYRNLIRGRQALNIIIIIIIIIIQKGRLVDVSAFYVRKIRLQL